MIYIYMNLRSETHMKIEIHLSYLMQSYVYVQVSYCVFDVSILSQSVSDIE